MCNHFGQFADCNDRGLISYIICLTTLPFQENKQKSGNTIVDITPGTILNAGTLHDNVIAVEHITDELGADTIVGLGEMRAIGMARTGYDNIGAILGCIAHGQRLGSAFGRRIAGARIENIHISVTALIENLSFIDAIHLTGRDIEEPFHVVSEPIFDKVGDTIEIGFHHLDGTIGEEIGTTIARSMDDEMKGHIAG